RIGFCVLVNVYGSAAAAGSAVAASPVSASAALSAVATGRRAGLRPRDGRVVGLSVMAWSPDGRGRARRGPAGRAGRSCAPGVPSAPGAHGRGARAGGRPTACGAVGDGGDAPAGRGSDASPPSRHRRRGGTAGTSGGRGRARVVTGVHLSSSSRSSAADHAISGNMIAMVFGEAGGGFGARGRRRLGDSPENRRPARRVGRDGAPGPRAPRKRRAATFRDAATPRAARR